MPSEEPDGVSLGDAQGSKSASPRSQEATAALDEGGAGEVSIFVPTITLCWEQAWGIVDIFERVRVVSFP